MLDTLEQALHERRPFAGSELICHSDRGSQYVSLRYTARLAEAGIEPLVRSVGDSYDNALAETVTRDHSTVIVTRSLVSGFRMVIVPWRPCRTAGRRQGAVGVSAGRSSGIASAGASSVSASVPQPRQTTAIRRWARAS